MTPYTHFDALAHLEEQFPKHHRHVYGRRCKRIKHIEKLINPAFIDMKVDIPEDVSLDLAYIGGWTQ